MTNLFLRLAGHAPEAVWNTVAQVDCLLPYYHMVSDRPVPHVSPLYAFRSVSQFQADVEFFLRTRRPVSLAEFIRSVQTTQRPPARSFLLTFDDGFREMAEIVAPILQRLGVPGVFFLNTCSLDNAALCHYQKVALLLDHRQMRGARFPDEFAARVLTAAGISGATVPEALENVSWSQRALLDEVATAAEFSFHDYLRVVRPYVSSDDVVAMLRAGMDVGAHSVSHPWYAELPLAEQLQQTRESMNALVRRFGLQRRAFAFPHNDERVSRDFFDTVFRDGTLDISFGTSSPAIDSVPLNFQRFSMERTRLPARAIVARNRLRRLKRLGRTPGLRIGRPVLNPALGSPASDAS